MLLAPTLAAVPPQEFEVRAACLYNFARFVEWPREAFTSDESPLTIGILGADPFGSRLESIVKGERVSSRPIRVVHYRTLAEVVVCHRVFISETECPRIDQATSALCGRPILTVCDWERSGAPAAMMRFGLAEGRLRLLVNLQAAKAAGLAVSAKLLRSAETVVGAETPP